MEVLVKYYLFLKVKCNVVLLLLEKMSNLVYK